MSIVGRKLEESDIVPRVESVLELQGLRVFPKIHVYALRNHYVAERRQNLNDILRAHWNDLAPEEREKTYGARARCFEEVDSPGDADVHLLTMKWNDYVDFKRIDVAWQAYDEALRWKKPFVVFSGGDSTANLPFPKAILFEPSSYRTRRNQRGVLRHAMPAFVDDYLARYCEGKLQTKSKGRTPRVGFCGQTAVSGMRSAGRTMVHAAHYAAYSLGLLRWEPTPYDTARLRQRVLRLLEKSPAVACDFIQRARYRAGEESAGRDPFHPTRMEFIQNILRNDYTVCARGGGNFSQRFYEVLSLGRIPVFVDTDCLLPFDQQVNYRDYCVWVEQSEIDRIGEKVADFHGTLPEKRFTELQHECRELWGGYLSMNGFYSHFRSLIQ